MIRLIIAAIFLTFIAACGGEDDDATPDVPLPVETGEEVTAPETPDEPDASRPVRPGDDQAGSQTGAPTGAQTGSMCGGIAGIACAGANDFCQFPEGQCRMPDASGTCTVKPEACTMQFDPVCGCDGTTYGNACEAAAAGVSVMSQGECAAAGTGEQPEEGGGEE